MECFKKLNEKNIQLRLDIRKSVSGFLVFSFSIICFTLIFFFINCFTLNNIVKIILVFNEIILSRYLKKNKF